MFKLVYGQEVVMPMEYIVPSLRVVALTEMTDVDVVEETFTSVNTFGRRTLHCRISSKCRKRKPEGIA